MSPRRSQLCVLCSRGSNFIDISTPEEPVIVGFVSSQSSCDCENCWWRDIRTVGDYAYIVSENEGHCIQVVDLKQLRGRKDAIIAYRRKLSGGAAKDDRNGRRKLSPVRGEVAKIFGTFPSPGKMTPRSAPNFNSARHLLFGAVGSRLKPECKASTLAFTAEFTASDSHNIVAFSVEDQKAGAPGVVITVGTDDDTTAHPYNRGGNPQGTAADTSLDGEICAGGLGIFDVSVNPAKPKYIGCHGTSHTHDTQCLIYKGPDTDHYGKPICISSNENHIDIVDMSVPFSPKSIAKLYGCGGSARTKAPEPFPPVHCDPSASCPPGGPCPNWKPSYAHQGWMTSDHRYFLLDDETDELDSFVSEMTGAPEKRLSVEIFDMTDLDAPFLIGYDVKDYDGYNHNIFVKGDLVIRADYENGIQFESATGAAMGHLPKLGFFDTAPPYGDDDGKPKFTACGGSWARPDWPCSPTGAPFSASWGGSWGVYPYFPSGLIAASSNGAAAGTFILKYTGPDARRTRQLSNVSPLNMKKNKRKRK